ncbi:MAG: hypothetical protein OXC45_03710 [Gemmatimonadetes bacterium]|nr:hypothetical protein [Gemmatimonadota bacterium]
MAKKKNSMRKAVPSRNRQQFQEDRNIPTIKVDIPMPKGAKPPKKDDGADLSPSRPEKSSSEKSS